MSEPVIDRALRDLGAHLEWPPEVDLASPVRDAIENVTPLRPRRRARRFVLVAAAALLVLTALLAVSPGLRAAFFRLLGIRGAAVEVHETVAPPTGSPFAGQALLGEQVTVAEAEEELGFTLSLPSGLGEGEGMFLLREGVTTIATVAYRDGDLIFSQFRGLLEEETVGKTVVTGQARRVLVDGAAGIWVEGDHAVFVRDPAGAIVESRPFVGGNTLLWSVGNVTFRLEGAPTLADALRIARSVAL
jgi:hypothetical protein